MTTAFHSAIEALAKDFTAAIVDAIKSSSLADILPPERTKARASGLGDEDRGWPSPRHRRPTVRGYADVT
jgi:hypothetical protein